MSDSWPVKVCRHIPSLMSQSLAEASQAPETNILVSGARDRLITSPVWPANVVVCWPVSMSHRALSNKHKHRSTTPATHGTSVTLWNYCVSWCHETTQSINILKWEETTVFTFSTGMSLTPVSLWGFQYKSARLPCSCQKGNVGFCVTVLQRFFNC